MKSISIPGKVETEQKWKLVIKAWPVLTVAEKTVSIDQAAYYTDLLSYHDIKFNLAYDDRVVTSENIKDRMIIEHWLTDDKTQKDHRIAFWLSHKGDGHNVLRNNQEISVCLACEVSVEDLVISNTMTGGGLILLGENEKSVELGVKTPIYRWLLEHKHEFHRTFEKDVVRAIVEGYA